MTKIQIHCFISKPSKVSMVRKVKSEIKKQLNKKQWWELNNN